MISKMKTVVVITLIISTIECILKEELLRPIQIVQLTPDNEYKLLRMIELYETGELDFWRSPSKVNATIDVMVNQEEKLRIEEISRKYSIRIKTIVEDLEKVIEDKEGVNNWRYKALSRLISGGKRDLSNSQNKNDFGLDLSDYHSYDEIVNWMRRIERSLPNNCQVYSIGKTSENRDMYGIKIGNPVNDRTKRVVWIDGGIHAREWVAPHTAIYAIYELVNGIIDRNQKLLNLLDNIEIVVFPVLNPDGYEYTRSDPRNALVRMWRKSRSPERCAKNRFGKETCCKGVDLNRNFDYRFAETGTSFQPCSEIYHGAGPFSEPETRNVRDAVTNSDLRGRIDGYISLHAYSQLWIYPYSNRKKSYPADIADLKKVAQKAVNAIGRLFGTHYLHGTGPEIIYAYTGGSSDWIKEKVKVKYSYTIELRPSYYSWNGFVLDKAQLLPTCREAFDGIMVVLETVSNEEHDRKHGIVRPTAAPVVTSPVTQRVPHPTSPRIPTSTGVCRDTVADCNRWLLNQPTLCATSRSSMRRQCALSCGFC